MNQIKIGELITKKRLQKKLTQSELGDLVGVSDKAVSKWERGVNVPDISLITPLSEILDISIGELLSGEENPIEENKSVVDGIKFYNRKTRKKFIILLSTICIILITILGLFFVNNYNQCKVYSIFSENSDYRVHGYLIFNPNENIVVLDEIKYQGDLLGTSDEPYIERFAIILKVKDTIIENIELEEVKGKVGEALKMKSLSFEDFDNEKMKILKKAKKEDVYLVFEYYNENNNKVEEKIELNFSEKFINDRFLYNKK